MPLKESDKVALLILYILSIVGGVYGWYITDCLIGKHHYSKFKNKRIKKCGEN